MNFFSHIILFILINIFIFISFLANSHQENLLQEIIKPLRQEEKNFALERLSYTRSNSFGVDLIKKNHQIIKNKENSLAKKVGFTAMNIVATPLGFVTDTIIGPINRDMIDGVHEAVKNPELPTLAKAKTIGLSIPYFLAAIPIGWIYRITCSVPNLFSAGATYSGFSFNDFRRTKLILKALDKNNYNSFWLGRVAKKVSSDGYKVTKEEAANILSPALNNQTEIYKEFLNQLDEKAAITMKNNPQKLGTLHLDPGITRRAGVPIGLDQMALLIKTAIRFTSP